MKHDKKAECSLLAVILLENHLMKSVRASGILPYHFQFSEHQLVYRAMLRLSDQKEPITLLTVAIEIKNQGLTECFCGNKELVRIFEPIFAIKDLEVYIEAIKSPYRGKR